MGNNTIPTICVVGGDGSGKSTQIERLAASCGRRGRTAISVSIWDAFVDPALANKLPFDEPSAVYEYLGALSPLSRTHFLFHAWHLALEGAHRRAGDVVLLNAYWYKYFATEIAHGGDPSVLLSLTAGFARPNRTIYLTIDPADALARKDQRSPYETGFHDDPAEAMRIQRRAHRVLDDLSDEYRWTRVDATLPIEVITNRLADELEGVWR